MNIKINKLSLTAFRSIDKIVELDFTSLKSKGLIFVSGKNTVEPELGSNGAGKSTLVDGITWILFGKTSVGLRAQTIHNWGSKRTTVGELTFTINGVEHALLRSWKPNKLKLDEETITQERLEEFLDLDYYSFLYSVYISQFGSKFFDLDPSVKLKVFTSILQSQLDRWNKASDVASKMYKQLVTNIHELEKDIARSEGSLASIDIKALQAKSAEFDESRANEIIKLEQNLLVYRQEVIACRSRLQQIANEIEDNKTKVSNRVIRSTERAERINELSGKINRVDHQVSITRNDKTRLITEISQLENLKEHKISRCPMCKSDINPQQLNAHIDELISERDRVDALHSEAVTRLDVMSNIYSRLWGKHTEYESETQRLKSTGVTLAHSKATLERDIEKNERYIESIVENIAELSAKKDPFESLIRQGRYKIAGIKKHIQYSKEELEDLNKLQIIVEYWAKKGFKEIRLMVLDESLKELEIQINNNLQLLGLDGWDIELNVESETKGGNLRREFTVLVTSPFGGGKLPIETWSGGEGQRLRLAGTLGLMDFVHNRRGTDWNIEWLDEPTQYLSEQGVESLIDVLFFRAKRLNKQIFLADHRALNAGGKFSDYLTVIKTKRGTRIEQ